MWTPKQLLRDSTIDALYLGGFKTLQIEFLGWLSWTAATLNHSRNPVKAAHTLLAKETVIKMLGVFSAKKRETIKPNEIATHDEADAMFAELEHFIDVKTTQAQMRASDYVDRTEQGVHDARSDEEASNAAIKEEEEADAANG